MFAVVADRFGSEALDRLYSSFGRLVHGGTSSVDIAVVLVDAGLPTDMAEAARTDRHDDLVRTLHHAALRLVGPHVGTLIVAVDLGDGRRPAWSGPVVSRMPRGEDAGRLWDGCGTTWCSWPRPPASTS